MILQSIKSLPVESLFKVALVVVIVFGVKFFFRVVKIVLSVLFPRGGLKRNFKK